VNGAQVIYTPMAGYSGPDSFTFSAADRDSQFPESPAVATVSIEVGEGPPQPSVTIAAAPAGMTAGTSAGLKATVANYTGSVEWSVSGGGTVTAEGPQGLDAILKAPPAEGSVIVAARLATDKAVSATRTIKIQAVPGVQPAQEPPPTPSLGPSPGSAGAGGVQGLKTTRPRSGLSRPRAMLFGHELVMTTVAYLGGRVRLSAYLGGRRLGTCVSPTPAGRRFTCRVKVDSKKPASERIGIVASLRSGGGLLTIVLPPEPIPRMTMTPASLHPFGRAAAYESVFWCSASTLIPSFAAGEV
jgi:hypothetical protein